MASKFGTLHRFSAGLSPFHTNKEELVHVGHWQAQDE